MNAWSIKLLTYLASIIAAVFGFLFGEVVFIMSLHYLKLLTTIIIFSVTFSVLSILLVKTYKEEKGFFAFKSIQNWIDKQEAKAKKYYSVLHTSKIITVIITNIFAGVLVSTILILVFGIEKKQAYLIAIVNNVVFFTLWALFYSGLLKQFIHSF